MATKKRTKKAALVPATASTEPDSDAFAAGWKAWCREEQLPDNAGTWFRSGYAAAQDERHPTRGGWAAGLEKHLRGARSEG